MPSNTDQHPFGTPEREDTASVPDLTPSIVDTILDLDDYLSGDVRRAEKMARFATEPWLEAEIDTLNAELESITDNTGRALDAGDPEASVASGGARTAAVVARELLEVQRRYAAATKSVRMQQMSYDDWVAFETKWKKALAAEPPYPPDMWRELIAKCAVAPRISEAQVDDLRRKAGHPQVSELGLTAWQVNRSSGVSVPKSPLSSRVLKQQERDES